MRAIGVVLTGMLDDGSAGLRAIKACGGTAVVQDPLDAYAPDMPQNALACVKADHVVPLVALGPLLYELACRPAPAREPDSAREALRQEHSASSGESTMEDLQAIATQSVFTCPDCGGVLFELDYKHPVRYRCHTGHGFSLLSLAHTQEGVNASALWTSLRTLREKEILLRRLAQDSQGSASKQALREADELAQTCVVLRRLMESTLRPQNFSAAGG